MLSSGAGAAPKEDSSETLLVLTMNRRTFKSCNISWKVCIIVQYVIVSSCRKLLEGEETRLGLSPGSAPEESGRGTKRKRIDLEESYYEGTSSQFPRIPIVILHLPFCFTEHSCS